MAERLLGAKRGPSPAEALLVAALFGLLALLGYGTHVADGGFYSDDWSHAAIYEFADSPRYLNSVADLQASLGGRPVSALLMPVPQLLFGPDPAPHLALAAAIGVLTSLCLFLLLRTLAMAPLHAGAIAALVLLFPWADSSRLWSTGSVNSLAVCFFLLGLTVALRGFDHPGRRGVAMHAGADLLYALSVLTYEVTAAPALLAGFLYLRRAPRAVTIRRWLADVAVVFAALLYSLLTTVRERPVATVSERVADLPDFLREALLLLSSALQPFGSMGRPLQGLVLLAAAGVLLALVLRLRSGDRPPLGNETLGGWPRWLLIGLLALAAAYYMFLGSNLHPRDGGINNRVNVFAGVAICVVVYATVACACQMLLRGSRARVVATVAVAAAIGLGYALKLRSDQAQWTQAAERQEAVLAQLDSQLLPLPADSTALVFGYPAQAAPGIPVFDRPWDLGGALQLRSNGKVASAYPVYEGISVSCGRSSVFVDGGGGYGQEALPYRELYFYGPGAGPMAIGSQRDCETSLRLLHPGPLEI